jgi:predicted secreted protein
MYIKFRILGSVFIVFLLVTPLLAFLQDTEIELVEAMPEDEGKELVTSLCVGCHSLGSVVSNGKSEEQWRDTINNMISRGAQIFDDEAETILVYLTKHYGVEVRSVGESLDSLEPVTEAELVEAMPEDEGKELVTSLCVGCHSLGSVVSGGKSEEQWRDTIDNMISRGAQIFDDEAETILTYLARHYGTVAESPNTSN